MPLNLIIEQKMIYKILVLENNYNRQREMQNIFRAHELTIVEKADQAIEKLQNSDWDVLCLDCDLGGEKIISSGSETGYKVAKWIEAHPQCAPALIVIHSYNPAGAHNIKMAVPQAYIEPFMRSQFWVSDVMERIISEGLEKLSNMKNSKESIPQPCEQCQDQLQVLKGICCWIRDNCDSYFGNEISEDLCPILERGGLVEYIPYDREIHGEIVGNEYMEDGDMFWHFTDKFYALVDK